jgi:hypothetical protein
MRDISIKNLIESQLPDFAREYHPLFVDFMTAYYEWLSSDENQIIPKTSMNNYLERVTDIDQTLDLFVEDFKKKYLNEFPVNLAINQKTGQKLNVKNVIKNIKKFYLAKGTEKSYKFLFRVIFNSDVDFYYPKKDMLILSNGKWQQDILMRLSPAEGINIFDYIGQEIYHRAIPSEPDSTYIFSAKLQNVSLREDGNYTIAELYVENPVGDIDSTNGNLYSNEKYIGKLQKILSNITIDNSGQNYSVGDKFVFESSTSPVVGIFPKASVSRVINFAEKVGQISEIFISDPGFSVNNFFLSTSNPIDSILPNATGYSGTLTQSYISFERGRYLNNDGKISSNKYIQDSRYYQEYSYVLKTDKTIDNLRSLVKKILHPAGYEFFGQILIQKCMSSEMSSFFQILSKKDYRIGNFLPYTFQTFDNLSEWFLKFCYVPEQHDSLIQSGGETAPIGNPISNNIEFIKITGSSCISEDFSPSQTNDIDYWQTFAHPNTFLNRGFENFGIGRIHRNQLFDFYGATEAGFGQGVSGWMEWILSAQSQKLGKKNKNIQINEEILESQINFFNGFDSESIKSQNVGLINRNNTEFRKIIIGSFLENIGFDYDCRKPSSPEIVRGTKLSDREKNASPIQRINKLKDSYKEQLI